YVPAMDAHDQTATSPPKYAHFPSDFSPPKKCLQPLYHKGLRHFTSVELFLYVSSKGRNPLSVRAANRGPPPHTVPPSFTALPHPPSLIQLGNNLLKVRNVKVTHIASRAQRNNHTTVPIRLLLKVQIIHARNNRKTGKKLMR